MVATFLGPLVLSEKGHVSGFFCAKNLTSSPQTMGYPTLLLQLA